MSTKNSKIHQEKVEKNRAFAQEQAAKKNSEKRMSRRLKGLQGISENLQDQIKTLRDQIHGTTDRKTLKDRMDRLVQEFDEWKKGIDERLMLLEAKIEEHFDGVHQAFQDYNERVIELGERLDLVSSTENIEAGTEDPA